MKLFKQVGTVAIASALLLTAAPQVWASTPVAASKVVTLPAKTNADLEPTITKDKALELAKTYITIPEGYTLQSANLNSYYMMNGHNVPAWNLNFSKKVKDQYYGNINVTINGMDGTLTGYNMNDSDPDHKPSYPPKVDFTGAKAIASAWIEKVLPGKQQELLYNQMEENSFRTPLDGNYQYNIRFDRSVDGVPFMQNGVNVMVNGDGQVTSYNYNWDDEVEFEKGITPIDKDKIADTFKDKANISLLYQIPYNAPGQKKPIITYQLNPFVLDAAKGELWNDGYIDNGGAAATKKPLTDKPLSEQPAPDLNLSKDEAVKRVTDAFQIPSSYQLQDASYNEYTNPDTGETTSSWNLNWNLATDDDPAGKRGGEGAWASINSKTGEIQNFNRYVSYTNDSSKPVDAKVSLEKATETAVELVKKEMPAYTDQLVLVTPSAEGMTEDQLKFMRNWDITFERVIDGVIANNETVTVSVDRTDGSVMNYYSSFSNMEYPKQKPEVIAVDKAKETLLSQYDIVLNYVTSHGGPIAIPLAKYNLMKAAGETIPAPSADTNAKIEAKLVYSLVPKYTQESYMFNAQSGEWLSASSGEVITLDRVKVDDIDNHWAKNELQLMLDYRALDVKDGKVNPDQAITRGEMVKMLVIAMNGGNHGIYYSMDRAASFKDVANGSKYFAYVENAVDRGLLDPGTEFNPDAKMTREDMAQLIVKALGYKTLTKYEKVFNQDFADKAQLKNVGEVAIVVGLDIMSLNDGSFGPDQEVTKAQAAVAFYRYLQKRSDLQDSPRMY
ncbi:S-layer homology domain-containing protein [Paenibacillus hexagrammi]|uniref:S-layer homology domain-containing protein n=1 Tax=Paenibacillus hexagrammi TaxID=2908839 RepID=A0ABY3SI25_9BACL|nr:S-layer homology domain-containing protein [Paenibacillus sp. YPD9-1]UJF33557.1 S-layer homology domain-containing protein [Paenibacillus sp. YPD9-1]